MEVEKMSGVTLVDEVTGLYNDSYFFERFDSEVARSVRYNIPITLVLMEITNFAEFAESTEKAVSDKLVKDLADILNSNVRETDLVARISESQFAVLFFQSTKSDAVLIADRIRTGAELRSLGTVVAKKAGLHLAVGLSGMPEDAENRDELYNQTYRFLEEAKRRGGSQVYFPP
jgi:diguanylate cyclase (GGDEF)-like protein